MLVSWVIDRRYKLDVLDSTEAWIHSSSLGAEAHHAAGRKGAWGPFLRGEGKYPLHTTAHDDSESRMRTTQYTRVQQGMVTVPQHGQTQSSRLVCSSHYRVMPFPPPPHPPKTKTAEKKMTI